VDADFQLEINLLTYQNPRRWKSSQTCCDTQGSSNCLIQNTCDTEIAIRLQNFDQLTNIGTGLLVGPYNDRDFITFPSCDTLLNNVQNPLVFTFSTAQFSVGVSKT